MNSDAAMPLLNFLAKLKQMTSDQDRMDALAQYAILDDSWAFQALRNLKKDATDPLLDACLGVALDRARSLRSIWKRKGDLNPEQGGLLSTYFKEFTSPETGTLRLQEARKRLRKHGVLLALFQFKPYVVDRATKQSVMLIQSRGSNLVPASELSPLIRHLQDLWDEDIHLYAFAELSNSISVDEVLQMMSADTAPVT